jgi:hypothetical protein
MDVAIKKIERSLTEKQKAEATAMLLREVKSLSRCRHKNIVQLIGVCVNPHMLVLAYAANGTLRDLLCDHFEETTPSRKVELLRGICDGMTMLHSQNVLHLDLKPENVLISADGTPWVADFGLAIAITTSLTAGAGSTTGGRGTMQYKAPEHFANDSDSDDSDKEENKVSSRSVYQKPADVYSFGIVCWEIFSGQVPYPGKDVGKIASMHVKAALNSKKIKRPPLDKIPSEMTSLTQACWAQDPMSRPTFRQVKEMLNAVPLLAVPGALNAPGYWDIFLSHTQRNAEGKLLALDFHTTSGKKKKSSWLDVKMDRMDMAAMEEGVKNSKCVVAIVTDECATTEDEDGPTSYFGRWLTVQELRWAVKYNVPIQPVVRAEDKKKIGDFIKMIPEDLKFLGGIDWKHLDRGNKRFFDLGVDLVLEGAEELQREMEGGEMQQMYQESRDILAQLESSEAGEVSEKAAMFASRLSQDVGGMKEGASPLSVCPPDALSWTPEMGTVEKALAEAKRSGTKMLYLERGEHVVKGEENEDGYNVKCAKIDFTMVVKGAGPGETVVKGGFRILGDGEKDQVRLETMTVSNPMGYGVYGYAGAKFEGKELSIDGCGGYGVAAHGTQGTLTSCTVTNCGFSGVASGDKAVIQIYGELTKVTGNCTNRGRSNDYGLRAYHSDSRIILHAPLTKESASQDNGGRGNWGGDGTIEVSSSSSSSSSSSNKRKVYDDDDTSTKKQRTQ